MSHEEDLLRRTYAAFNARDIDGALSAMHPHVEWPNGMEGGVVHGHDGIRQYWTRQWSLLDPYVEPEKFQIDPPGRVAISVHQIIRDLEGKILIDRMVEHIYTIENSLITKMEIRETE